MGWRIGCAKHFNVEITGEPMSVYFKTSATMKLPSTDPDKSTLRKYLSKWGGEEGGIKKVITRSDINVSVHYITHKASTYSYKTR